MDKNNLFVFGAVLVLFIAMVSFNVPQSKETDESFFDAEYISGKVGNDIVTNISRSRNNLSLPDLKVEKAFFFNYVPSLRNAQALRTANLNQQVRLAWFVINTGNAVARGVGNNNAIKYSLEIINMDNNQIVKRITNSQLALGSVLRTGGGVNTAFGELTHRFTQYGRYCINVQIDTLNNVIESNEHNNLFNDYINCIQVGLPDLIVSDTAFWSTAGTRLAVNSQVPVGTGVHKLYITKNNGVGIARMDHNYIQKHIIKKDGTIISSGDGNPQLYFNPGKELGWAVGGTTLLNQPGRYCIDVELDTRNSILESNENNNVVRDAACINVR